MPAAQAENNVLQSESELEYYPEGYPMTFQIALVGSDGILLGSDRLMTYQTIAPENLATQRTETTKFVKSTDGSMFCFFAGSANAVRLANTIAASCSTYITEAQWANQIQQAVRGFRPPLPAIDEVLIVHKSSPSRLLIVQKGNGDTVHTAWIESWLCTGDNSPARFIPLHLYKRTAIAALKPLALLTLAYASKESPGIVGIGFDLVAFRADGTIQEERYADAEAIKQGEMCAIFGRGLQNAFLDSAANAPLPQNT